MMPTGALYAYAPAQDTLVFVLPSGQGYGIPVAVLRQLGWTVTGEGLSRSLPRFGPPTVQQAGSMAAAHAMARSAKVGRA